MKKMEKAYVVLVGKGKKLMVFSFENKEKTQEFVKAFTAGYKLFGKKIPKGFIKVICTGYEKLSPKFVKKSCLIVGKAKCK